MTEQKNLIELPRAVIISIALEVWRLWRIAEKMDDRSFSVNIRYSTKKMKNALETNGCSFIDLSGEAYDTGMAVDVIDTEGKEKRDGEYLFVKEMISPIILFDDNLLKHGQAILEWRSKS